AAFVRTDQPEDASDRGGLARAVRSEEPEHPTVGDLEVESVHGHRPPAADPSVLLAETVELDHPHGGEPYPGRGSRADGCRNGTADRQPVRRIPTRDGGVRSVTWPLGGRDL